MKNTSDIIFYLEDSSKQFNIDLEEFLYEFCTKKNTGERIKVDIFIDKKFLKLLETFATSEEQKRAYLYFKYHCNFDKILFSISYSKEYLAEPIYVNIIEFNKNFKKYFNLCLSGKDIFIENKANLINFLLT